jgi:hypothetical protein
MEECENECALGDSAEMNNCCFEEMEETVDVGVNVKVLREEVKMRR